MYCACSALESMECALAVFFVFVKTCLSISRVKLSLMTFLGYLEESQNNDVRLRMTL